MKKYYEKDLAEIHNEKYSELSIKASELLFEKLRKNNIKKGNIIDLGCGSGKLLAFFASKGYKTIGVDISKELLKLGLINSPKSELVHQSIWDYEIPKCIAVTAIGEIITYQFDDKNTDENIGKLFKMIYDQLEEEGIFVFDYLEPNIINSKADKIKIKREGTWMMIIEYEENKKDQELTRDITVFRLIKGDKYRKVREVHNVRLLERTKIKKLLEEIGFEVEEIKEYNGLKLRDKHVGMICYKKSP